jgi:hypothetical protein
MSWIKLAQNLISLSYLLFLSVITNQRMPCRLAAGSVKQLTLIRSIQGTCEGFYFYGNVEYV